MIQWLLGFLLIGLAGGIGSVIRALLSKLDGWLPYGMFLANSLAAGLVAWIIGEPGVPALYLAILSIGLASGLSTFSTAMKASFDFYHRGRLTQAVATMIGNLVAPMLAVMLAAALR